MPFSSTLVFPESPERFDVVGDVFNRLAALWSTPRVGRVAICSPLVGLSPG